jgi:hypothetical protein
MSTVYNTRVDAAGQRTTRQRGRHFARRVTGWIAKGFIWLSFASILTLAAMWGRSYWRVDHVFVRGYRPNGLYERIVTVQSCKGVIEGIFWRSKQRWPYPKLPREYEKPSPAVTTWDVQAIQIRWRDWWRGADREGFWRIRVRFRPTGASLSDFREEFESFHYCDFRVPYALMIVPALPGPVIWITRRRRARRRARRGFDVAASGATAAESTVLVEPEDSVR